MWFMTVRKDAAKCQISWNSFLYSVRKAKRKRETDLVYWYHQPKKNNHRCLQNVSIWIFFFFCKNQVYSFEVFLPPIFLSLWFIVPNLQVQKRHCVSKERKKRKVPFDRSCSLSFGNSSSAKTRKRNERLISWMVTESITRYSETKIVQENVSTICFLSRALSRLSPPNKVGIVSSKSTVSLSIC